MFLSTMNVVVGGSAAPAASKIPFVLSKAGASRSASAAGASRFPQSVPASRDRIDLSSQKHRHPLITMASDMPGARVADANV